jgi:rhodanese-related sulfurtransferase
MSYGPIPTIAVDEIPEPLPADLHVIDVREGIEWQHGHIEGATHIPLGELPARSGDLPDGRLLVVCKVGGRSAWAVNFLTAKGHDAVNLDGGMLDWAGAGRPMASETGKQPHVV